MQTQTLRQEMMPDPLMSDAEFIHQRRRKPDSPHVGMVPVERNTLTVIGGLTYIRRRERHHERAAERFLNLYEARYGRVAPAIDMSKVRVDTSIIGHDGEMVAAIDRTRDIEDAEAFIGHDDFNRIVAVVCLGARCEDNAPRLPSGKANWRVVKSETDAVLHALDRLAQRWGYAGRKVA